MASDSAVAANGHIQIDSYTITYGQTKVQIRRDGAMWHVGYYGDRSPGARFPHGDYEPMMAVAIEYAKKLDTARRAIRAAEQEEVDVHRWLEEQTYTEPAGARYQRSRGDAE